MDAPILYFFSFLSADYEVIEKYWNDVKMQIMYHSSHGYNTDRMMESLENSFEYFSEEFGEYQFKQIRILEFPRYAAFAQSFPNTVPFSEGIGFIARLKTNDDIDYPYYVTWWLYWFHPLRAVQVFNSNTNKQEGRSLFY